MKTTFRFLICIALVFMLTGKLCAQTNVTTTGGTANYIPKFNGTSTVINSTIYDNGNIGIGTTSPSGRIHISGSDYTTSRSFFQRYSGGGWGPCLELIALNNTGSYILTDRGLGFLNFWGEYNLDNNYALGASIGAYTTQNWSSSGYGTKIIFKTTENNSTTSTERLVIDNNGYVGINQTTPGSMLDVKGTLRLSGSTSGYVGFSPAAAAGSTIYTLPTADGDSGQFLHTDGSGTLSWQTPTTSATAWQLTGNSGTSSPFLGTTDNYPLDFKTNGALRMTIEEDGTTYIGGNVSIGYYTAPVEKLQVVGNAVFVKPMHSSELYGSPFIRGGFGYSTSVLPDYSWYDDDSTGIFHPAYKEIAFTYNGSESMRINYKGLVGIGTSNPASFLHVALSSIHSLGSHAALFTYGPDSNYTGKLFIVPKLNNYSYDSLSVLGDQGIFWSDNQGTGGKNSAAGFILAPYCNKYNGIRITADGNVGIGTPFTNNPQNYKLAVNGFIGAKEIYVENTSTTWPDYVFSNDYNLPSLNEVEKFVNENKHLPDVPSAAEVAEKGQAMGEMNAILLKKVEELTLYIIEQNKRMDEQQRKIQELELKVNRQQNQ